MFTTRGWRRLCCCFWVLLHNHVDVVEGFCTGLGTWLYKNRLNQTHWFPSVYQLHATKQWQSGMINRRLWALIKVCGSVVVSQNTLLFLLALLDRISTKFLLVFLSSRGSLGVTSRWRFLYRSIWRCWDERTSESWIWGLIWPWSSGWFQGITQQSFKLPKKLTDRKDIQVLVTFIYTQYSLVYLLLYLTLVALFVTGPAVPLLNWARRTCVTLKICSKESRSVHIRHARPHRALWGKKIRLQCQKGLYKKDYIVHFF